MNNVIKPLLATKADFDKIRYPVLATPKLDGIRCLIVDGVPMSRSMKPIPNKYVQAVLSGLPELDGELMVDGDFNHVQSAIMSKDKEVEFTFNIFDTWRYDEPYHLRVRHIDLYCSRLGTMSGKPIKALMPTPIENEEQLIAYLDKCLEEGYEGVMIRDPEGKYKHGRSTVKEGILLKIKRFIDDEATIVAVHERYHNTNELQEDELGYAKRRSTKDAMQPTGYAGAVDLEWQGKRFKVGFGPGFTDARKKEWWDDREWLVGETVTFRYQELSKDGIPRFGKLVGLRHEDDIS